MNIKNTIIEHYRKFFDLHAKGIALDEDDHLTLDWAEDLVKNCFIPNVSNNEVALKAFVEEFVEAWEDGMGGDTDLYRKAKSLL